jgi:uncharacterized protein (DUF1778 family)
MNKKSRTARPVNSTEHQPVSIRPRSEDRPVIDRIAHRHGLSRHDVIKLALAAGLQIIEERLAGKAA